MVYGYRHINHIHFIISTVSFESDYSAHIGRPQKHLFVLETYIRSSLYGRTVI